MPVSAVRRNCPGRSRNLCRLAAHEYPREIEFLSKLSMMSTGKIMRDELGKEEIRKMGAKSIK